MAYLDRAGFPYTITLFGVVAAAAFFMPGWKYLRQSRRGAAARENFERQRAFIAAAIPRADSSRRSS